MIFFNSIEQMNQHAKCLFDLAEVEAALDLVVQHLTQDLADKQPVAFAGSETVMRWIGG